MYRLQFCKLIHNTITGCDVDQNRFTLASFARSHKTRFSKKKKNFFTERPKMRLGLNCSRYLGPNFRSNINKTFKNFKIGCFKFSNDNFLLNNYKE